MHRLHDRFGQDVDFIGLDVDLSETLSTRQSVELFRRSQYTLLDGQGRILKTWIGPLDAELVGSEMAILLFP